jgi:hypothetical protein
MPVASDAPTALTSGGRAGQMSDLLARLYPQNDFTVSVFRADHPARFTVSWVDGPSVEHVRYKTGAAKRTDGSFDRTFSPELIALATMRISRGAGAGPAWTADPHLPASLVAGQLQMEHVTGLDARHCPRERAAARLLAAAAGYSSTATVQTQSAAMYAALMTAGGPDVWLATCDAVLTEPSL